MVSEGSHKVRKPAESGAPIASLLCVECQQPIAWFDAGTNGPLSGWIHAEARDDYSHRAQPPGPQSFGIPSDTELAEIEGIFRRGGSMLSFPMQHSGQWLLAEVYRLRHEVMRLENAVDLERRLKVAARKDADEVRAEVRRNLDHPWPPPRTRS